jgi:hypothetical protein
MKYSNHGARVAPEEADILTALLLVIIRTNYRRLKS